MTGDVACWGCGARFHTEAGLDEETGLCGRCMRQVAPGNRECRGHPAGPFDPMGETVYCDGSCRRRAVRAGLPPERECGRRVTACGCPRCRPVTVRP